MPQGAALIKLSKVQTTVEEYRDQLLESVKISIETAKNKIEEAGIKSIEVYSETAGETKFQVKEKLKY